MHPLILFLILSQQNAQADSRCVELKDGIVATPGDGAAARDTVWVVDDALATELIDAHMMPERDGLDEDFAQADPNEGALTSDDIRLVVDQALQGFVRHGRVRIRPRVIIGTCEPDNQTDGKNCVGSIVESGLAAGHADCTRGGECDLFVRIKPNVNRAWSNGAFASFLTHELGHAYGLDHPYPTELDSETCANINVPRTPCPGGWTDGCGGELMCGSQSCRMGYVREGDAIGMRTVYNTSPYGQLEERRVFWGVDSLPIGSPSLTFSGFTSAFEPRIDCAESSSPINQCVMVTAQGIDDGYRVNSLAVIRLNGFSNGAFATATSVLNSTNRVVTLAPDVAISKDGSLSFTAFTDRNLGGQVFVREVDLTNGAVHLQTMPAVVTSGTALGGAPLASLPPRVAATDDNGGGAIAVYARVPDGDSAEQFGRHIWEVVGVFPNASTEVQRVDASSVFPVSDAENRSIATDFDVDCLQQSGTDVCVIVAKLFDSSPADPEHFRSRRFTINWTTHIATPVDGWQVGAYQSNAVLGVAAFSTGTTTRLVVSAGRSIMASSATENTRLVEYGSLGVAGNGLYNVALVSDAEACTGTSGSNATMPPLSTSGGYSLAWCPSCGANGSLISTQFGRRFDPAAVINGVSYPDSLCY